MLAGNLPAGTACQFYYLNTINVANPKQHVYHQKNKKATEQILNSICLVPKIVIPFVGRTCAQLVCIRRVCV